MMAVMTYPELFLWLAACLLFVLISGLFSGSETGLYCVNSLRLRLAVHDRNPSAIRLQGLLTDRTGLLLATLFGTNLANYLAPVCLTIIFMELVTAETIPEREHLAELYTTLILTPIVFIFGEVVPKNVFQRNADRLMIRVSTILRVTHQLLRFTGIIAVQKRISDFAYQRLNRRPASGSILHSRGDVYRMLRESAAAGALTLTQSSILERIGMLKNIRVGSVMVPLGGVVMLDGDANCKAVEQTIRKTRFSRMPTYRGKRRNIIGVVHLLDVLTASPEARVETLARPPIRISAKAPVIDALATLQRAYRRMAIITDRTERPVGIVTVKDLVEEIVGELAAW